MITDTRHSDDPAERLAVRVEKLYKVYRNGTASTPVLNGIDLGIQKGECVYLAGPSGSGKTTLLSILGCILSPDHGLVEILGQDVSRLTPAERVTLRRDRLGFAFQKHHLIRGLTAAENVCVPMTLRGISRAAAMGRAMTLLKAVGLADKGKAHPRNMSTGQCQRVALARALANDPQLILADEPTAALDGANGQEVMGLLRRLVAEQGKTAIVVTHDQRIFHFADRIFWLENGRVAETRQSSIVSPVVYPSGVPSLVGVGS
jgi:putative ABC transport system ATP-binding protein